MRYVAKMIYIFLNKKYPKIKNYFIHYLLIEDELEV
jgi:hypothetical protein